jgi:hypothetical protein
MLAPRESYSVSSMLALREISELKLSMTKSQAEVVLHSFVVKGWLHQSKYVLFVLDIGFLICSLFY